MIKVITIELLLVIILMNTKFSLSWEKDLINIRTKVNGLTK